MNVEELENVLSGAGELTGFWLITNDGLNYQLENLPYEVVLCSDGCGTTHTDNLVVVRNPQLNKQVLSASADGKYATAIERCDIYPPDLIFYGDILR